VAFGYDELIRRVRYNERAAPQSGDSGSKEEDDDRPKDDNVLKAEADS
jgi:hypothetical protein